VVVTPVITTEAGGLQVPSQPGLHSEFQVSQGDYLGVGVGVCVGDE
jgi:hypothetical protein